MLVDAFEKYVSNYDMNDENIKLKYDHSYRVMKLQEKYAKKLGFSEEDIELAKIIGLLHDIGRFEQLRVYHTYRDRDSVDHADYSVVQLFDKGLISEFTNRVEDYDLIKFAIKNHNKIEIEECNDERVLKHARLIRDCDKLDIMYLLGYLGELNYKAIDAPISENIKKKFYNGDAIKFDEVNNKNEFCVLQFSFIYDLYNDCVLEEYKTNLGYYYKKLDGEMYFKEIYEKAIDYLNERIDKYDRNGN